MSLSKAMAHSCLCYPDEVLQFRTTASLLCVVLGEVPRDGHNALLAHFDGRPTERVPVNGRRGRVAVSPVETLQAAEVSRKFDEIVAANPQDSQTDQPTEAVWNRTQVVHEQ